MARPRTLWRRAPAGASRTSSAPPARATAPSRSGTTRVCIARGDRRNFPIPHRRRARPCWPPGRCCSATTAHCFECGHEHGVGDRCLSFHFAPEFLEERRGRSAGRAASRFPRRGCRRCRHCCRSSPRPKRRARMATRRARGTGAASRRRGRGGARRRQAAAARRRAAATSGGSPPRCAGSRRRRTSRCRSPIWRARRR